MLNLVQDAAPDGELRRSVTDTALLKRQRVIFEAVLHQPRLQRSAETKVRLTVLTQWSNARPGGITRRIVVRIDQIKPSHDVQGSTK